MQHLDVGPQIDLGVIGPARVRATALASLAALVLAACSSSSASTAGTDMDAGSAASETDAAPLVCTMLDYAGAPVMPTAVAGAAPAAKGGQIVAGIYRLTAYKVYNTTIPPNPPTIQASIKFAANGYEISFQTTNGLDKESGTVTTTGTMLQFSQDCPKQEQESERRYTVSGSELDLYDVSMGGATDPVEIATYQKE